MTYQVSTSEKHLLEIAAEWLGSRQLRDLSDEVLCELARVRGIDFATAVLYAAVTSSDGQTQFMDRTDEYLQALPVKRRNIDAALAVVPGAFYREHPGTGADGKKLLGIAREFGCRAYTIPAESVGNPTVNGQIICDWLSQTNEENIILCSLSKGGADVKVALANPGARAAFRNVVAWVNVGGIMNGSPMATWILGRPILSRIYRALFWYRNQNFDFVRDIARYAGSPLDFDVVAPPHVKVVHVLGFPLTHHLRGRPTVRWHRRLARYGPNDGAAILADSCRIPGQVLPVWGDDHYLNTRYSPEKLLATILQLLSDDFVPHARSTQVAPCVARSVTA